MVVRSGSKEPQRNQSEWHVFSKSLAAAKLRFDGWQSRFRRRIPAAQTGGGRCHTASEPLLASLAKEDFVATFAENHDGNGPKTCADSWRSVGATRYFMDRQDYVDGLV